MLPSSAARRYAGRQAEILLEPDVAFLAPAHRPGGHQQVHVDAVRRPDQVQVAPALPDELTDHGHGQPGGQAAAERDDRTVADQRHRVSQAGSLVPGRLQAHPDPPGVLLAGWAGARRALLVLLADGVVLALALMAAASTGSYTGANGGA